MLNQTQTYIRGTSFTFSVTPPLDIDNYTDCLIEIIQQAANASDEVHLCKLSMVKADEGYSPVITIDGDTFSVPVSSAITSAAELSIYDLKVHLISDDSPNVTIIGRTNSFCKFSD